MMPSGPPAAPRQHRVKQGGGGAWPGLRERFPHRIGTGGLPTDSPSSCTLSSQPVLSYRGQGGLPPRRRGARGQPRTLISAESDTRLAESVDIYYCSQESGARGGGGQAGRGEKEGGECGACGRPGCVCELAKEAG